VYTTLFAVFLLISEGGGISGRTSKERGGKWWGEGGLRKVVCWKHGTVYLKGGQKLGRGEERVLFQMSYVVSLLSGVGSHHRISWQRGGGGERGTWSYREGASVESGR